MITNNRAIAGNNGDTTSDPTLGGAFGGAIENNYAAVLNITNSVISGNTAVAGANTVGQGGMAVGGGITNSPHATMNMTNCIVSGNSAIGGKGVGVAGGFAFGGGIDISNSRFDRDDHQQPDRRQHRRWRSGRRWPTGQHRLWRWHWRRLGRPGGLRSRPLATDARQLRATRQSSGRRSRRCSANGGDGLGGGLAVITDSSATVTGSVISLNSAVGGKQGSGSGTSAGHGIGGGVYREGTFDDLLTLLAFNLASTSNNNIYP